MIDHMINFTRKAILITSP